MKKLKIDFGSGYNHKNNFKSCDFTLCPLLDYHYDIDKNIIEDLDFESVDEFYIRNVIHHLPDIKYTLTCLDKYLKIGGYLTIIDVRKEFYKQNVFLDRLWYRFIIPRNDIWFSEVYREYKQIILGMNYKLVRFYNKEEKEVSIWKKL